jgi:hypothetical protein
VCETVKVIKLSELKADDLKQFIDVAGFNTINSNHGFDLVDKKNPNADIYADLRFRTLFEAFRAVQTYITGFRFVA